MGMKDNFWSMGDTGPCGPCSEIHFRHGSCRIRRRPSGLHVPCDCGRYVEIWNLVFMQFDREQYRHAQPAAQAVDRLRHGFGAYCAVLQGVISNYDTDLFMRCWHPAAKLTEVDLEKELAAEKSSRSAASLRVVADHASRGHVPDFRRHTAGQ